MRLRLPRSWGFSDKTARRLPPDQSGGKRRGADIGTAPSRAYAGVRWARLASLTCFNHTCGTFA